MRGFMKALEKAGLVELDNQGKPEEETVVTEDVDALIARELAQPANAMSSPTENDAPDTVTPATTIDSRSFESIFAEAAIPGSPYPAEKMLRLLDGLKAMDVGSRKMAVEAMDAADDTWTIDDAVLDAQRKMAALAGEKDRVNALMLQLVAQNQQMAQAREEQQRSKVEALRQEIAELERTMASEIASAGADKAALMAAGENARLAAQREAARLDAEIERFEGLARLFATKN